MYSQETSYYIAKIDERTIPRTKYYKLWKNWSDENIEEVKIKTYRIKLSFEWVLKNLIEFSKKVG